MISLANCVCVGYLQGFDEFMNLVVDDAVEVRMATKDEAESRRELGSSSPLLKILPVCLRRIV